jgi:hypothetical protein
MRRFGLRDDQCTKAPSIAEPVTNNQHVRPDVEEFHILDIRQPGIDLARFHDFARFAASYSRTYPVATARTARPMLA